MELLDMVAETYGKEKPSGAVVGLWFNLLSDYTFEQVSWAISQHLKNPNTGQFMPKPADVIKQLEGTEITIDQIIAYARNPICPLGVFARIQIGHWNLDNLNEYELKPHAQSAKLMIPEWKARLKSGQLTDHELLTFEKYKVNPQKGFVDGMHGNKLEGINEKLALAKRNQHERQERQNTIALEHQTLETSPEALETAKQLFNKNGLSLINEKEGFEAE